MESKKIELDEFGLYEGISETIVTTHQDWSPNAAPMGIIRKQDTILIRIFKGSRTYQNVIAEDILVANITNDPVAFVKYTFSDVEPEELETVSSLGMEFYVLKAAQSWVAFECINTKVTPESLVAELKPLRGHVNTFRPKAVNRGLNAIIEATIHATRYKLHGEEKYLNLIKLYADIISKCGGDREKEALQLLYAFL